VDTVPDLDDILNDDQPSGLVLANLGLEPLDSQQVAAGCLHLGVGDLEASLEKLDDIIQVLEPFIERHELVIILGNLWCQTGQEVVPLVSGAEEALHCRVPGISQLPPDVYLPEEVGA